MPVDNFINSFIFEAYFKVSLENVVAIKAYLETNVKYTKPYIR
jgi:hypothetical protein